MGFYLLTQIATALALGQQEVLIYETINGITLLAYTVFLEKSCYRLHRWLTTSRRNRHFYSFKCYKYCDHWTISDGCYFNGSIDDVRIYNRALSAAEVLQLLYKLEQGR